jgi:hypothetical protein
MPPDSPVGFAPADWLLLLITALFLLAAFTWRPAIEQAFAGLARSTRSCLLLLFLLPIILRLLLLPQHPVPTPGLFQDFGDLLVADTLLHGRLANPPHVMHQFFETFFVLQEPTYSSTYPLAMGLVLALGRLLSGIAWTGVLIASGAFCASCYWMLRAWVTPGWALLGGLLAVIEFGPLCQWTNCYCGGFVAATGGCLVFGALPRLHSGRRGDAFLLGAGCGLHLLSLPLESGLLFLAIALFFVPGFTRLKNPMHWRVLPLALAALLPAVFLILLHNRAVTHSWTTRPEQLGRYQYGVPSSLTIEPNPVPHVPLTPQQAINYRAETLSHGSATDSPARFALRLEYRVRDYRFFFLPPLYLALAAFLFALRDARLRWAAATLAIFALGTNLFPDSPVDHLAGIACLFVLASVTGLRQLSRARLGSISLGPEIAQILVVLCLGEFMTWYGLHLFESPAMYPILRYETWDGINHVNAGNQQARSELKRRLDGMPGRLLVFVRYAPHHFFQNEWVWNNADIDHARIVYARDLGPEEDEKLIRYYPARKTLLLEPDGPVPHLADYAETRGLQ